MQHAALRSTKGFAAVAALVLGAGYFISSTEAASAGPSAVSAMHSVEGAWDATIDFAGVPFRAMYSFHADCTMTEADNPGFDPSFNGDALSPGIGSWEDSPSPGIDARAKYQKFAYGVNGLINLVYTSKLQMRNADGDSLNGVVDIEIALPDGTVVNTIPNLTFSATRISAF